MSNAFSSTTTRIAFCDTFDAVITPGTYAWKATLTWKAGHRGNEVIATTDESSLRRELTKLNPNVKFAQREPATLKATVATQNADLLKKLRVDPTVDSRAYVQACKKLGAEPQPRPDFTQSTETGTEIVPMRTQALAFTHFQTIHPELFGQHADYNAELVERYLADERLQMTWTNLHTAFVALESHEMFRHESAGRMGGRICRPYDNQLIRSDRARKQTEAANVVSVPAHLKGVDIQLWNFVRAENPTMNVQSPQFAARMKEVLVNTAIREVQKAYPHLTDTESSIFRKLVDQQILAFAKQGNAKLGVSNLKSAKVFIDRMPSRTF